MKSFCRLSNISRRYFVRFSWGRCYCVLCWSANTSKRQSTVEVFVLQAHHFQFFISLCAGAKNSVCQGDFGKLNKCVWHPPLDRNKSHDFVSVYKFQLADKETTAHALKAAAKENFFPIRSMLVFLIFHFTEKWLEEGCTMPHVFPLGMNLCELKSRLEMCGCRRIHCFENKNFYLGKRTRPEFSIFWHFHFHFSISSPYLRSRQQSPLQLATKSQKANN